MAPSQSKGYVNGHEEELVKPRLLVHVVENYAKHDPQKVWGALPKDASDASKGYEDITFGRLSYAVDRAARWLSETLNERKTNDFEPLAYIGPPDSRYVIFVLASIKAGYQMLFLSTRNSDEAQYHVLKQAKCSKFLCASSMRNRVDDLVQKSLSDEDSRSKDNGAYNRTTHETSRISVLIVPEQEDLLRDAPEPQFPYNKTMHEARSEPLVILHTSSTTGMPKTIPLNQGYGFHEDMLRQIPNSDGLDIITRKPFYGDCRMFVAMPLFHAGGVLLTLLKSLYHDIVAVFQPPAVPLSAMVFDGILRYGKCNGCVLPPSLLEEMIAVPSYFDMLASLKFVQFGSGPLSKAAGDTLLTRQKNCPHYIGSSEIALPPLLELDNPVKDWQYFHFHPWSGVDMRPLSGDDGMFEMFVKRIDRKAPGLQPVFELFPDIEEWPTRDLYMQHPTKPGLFRSAGRSDDVIVLSNGEKLNPVDTESRVTNAIPSVIGAVVFGQARFVPGLLLEVKGVDTADAAQLDQVISGIWPIIQQANREAAKHAQLSRSSIILTSPDKPFARTPKLSVRRGPTLQLYSDEIADMYERLETDLEASTDVDVPTDVDLTSSERTQDLLQHLVIGLTGWTTKPKPADDLFMLGMDSLHVARLARAMKLALTRNKAAPAQLESVTSRMIYGSPTIEHLVRSLQELANESPADVVANGHMPREAGIESKIEKYSKFDYPSSNGDHSKPPPEERRTILLTGSTGSLGTYLLATFLRDPNVTAVYCLNRTITARARQLEGFETQGLSITTEDLDKRVHFLHSESLAAPNLGLEESAYRSLLQAAPTHILHNAWPVNFNLNLASFEPHIAGVKALIDFCSTVGGATLPEFTFVSSLSSVTSLSYKPESIVVDASIPSKMGYGESKYAAEQVLNAAAVASGGRLASKILRVGQIAGPVGWLHDGAEKSDKGIWPMREWLPSLIVSSLSIRVLPETLGRMDALEWLPVDMLAGIVSELVKGGAALSNGDSKGLQFGRAGEAQIYNLINPNAVSWKDLLPTVQQELGIDSIIPLTEWIERVRTGPHETDKIRPNPAKKILDFYEALVIGKEEKNATLDAAGGEARTGIATAAVAGNSETFNKLGPVRRDWMKTWIGQWGLKKSG